MNDKFEASITAFTSFAKARSHLEIAGRSSDDGERGYHTWEAVRFIADTLAAWDKIISPLAVASIHEQPEPDVRTFASLPLDDQFEELRKTKHELAELTRQHQQTIAERDKLAKRLAELESIERVVQVIGALEQCRNFLGGCCVGQFELKKQEKFRACYQSVCIALTPSAETT